MKSSQLKVTQDPQNAIPVEVLADSIVQISQGVKKILAGPLNESAVILLITNATPATGGRYNKKPVSASTVRSVLRGMESLEREYLKPKKL